MTNVTLFNCLDVAIAPGYIPSELQLEKILYILPLRVRLAAILDFNAQAVRTKISIKERFFNGSIRYLPSQQELEYRKRFQLFGFVPANVWARWDLRRFSDFGGPAPGWQPRVGFGLGLCGSPLVLLGGGVRAAVPGPLSLSFKSRFGGERGLRGKAYFDVSLPRQLIFGDQADDGPAGDDDYGYGFGGRALSPPGFDQYSGAGGGGGGGGGGNNVRLLLRKTALVLTL